jgi:hypothetical protein
MRIIGIHLFIAVFYGIPALFFVAYALASSSLLHSNRIMAIVLINAHDKERIDKTRCCVDNHHCDQQDKHSFKVAIARHMGIVSFGAPLLYGFQSTFHF